MKVVTAAQMRSIEGAAEESGTPLSELMSRAGQAVAERAAAIAGGGRVLILAGPGNNGGDGLVAAQGFASQGQPVSVFTFRRPHRAPYRGDVIALQDEGALEALGRELQVSRVVVDSLLGIGASRPPEGVLADVLHIVNQRDRQRTAGIAVDISTGVDSDTGNVSTLAFQADLTLAMGFAKVGNVVYPGAAFGGTMEVVDVGLTDSLAEGIEVSVPAGVQVASLLPARAIDSNKGTHGRVLVVAGSHDFLGAPALSSLAAYRSGAGLVEVVCTERVQTSVAMHATETVFSLYPARDGRISRDALQTIETALRRAAAMVYGPGLGLSGDTVAAARAVLALVGREGSPAVWDADGLNALAQIEGWWTTPAPMVLTPHPGEMSRLTGLPIPQIQADRLGTARRFAAEWNKTVVLKGAGTVVASPDGRASINPTGGANLATAGTGDVLSGIIGGLLAQGCRAWEAAVAGVYLHGLAGDIAAERLGDSGTVASDLLPRIPRARLRILETKE